VLRTENPGPLKEAKSSTSKRSSFSVQVQLGGHPRDPKNLWPEMWGTPATTLTSRGPFPSHLIGAKSKDAVENALHKEVCARALTLDEAQRIIVTDWFKYYRDTVLK